MKAVAFRQMKDGTREEYEFLTALVYDHHRLTADRLLAALAEMEEGLSGYQVTRLGHSLQTATRAWNDGADTDWIVTALLHDIGDTLAPFSHADYAAAILKPFVREQCAWVTRTHGEFQLVYYGHLLDGFDPNRRERHRGHLYFDDCAAFCERWDQASFDPDYETLPLDFFAPLVREVFARQPYDPAVLRPGAREPLVNA
jgi:predicted HD phosphohydrolase